MRSLKCSNCGGSLAITVTDEGMAIGRCEHCGADYLLDKQRKQYVIVEHRYAGEPVRATTPISASKQRFILGAAAGLIALTFATQPILSLFNDETATSATASSLGASVVFNVGSEGSSPGQFRDNPNDFGIDGLGRAVVSDVGGRIYIFGPDGRFITNHPKFESHSDFVAFLPNGSLILYNSYPKGFGNYDPVTGRIVESVEMAAEEEFNRANIAGAVTPNGGFAVYATRDDNHGSHTEASLPPPDALIIYGSDMIERRRLTGLLKQAIARDPMVQKPPRVSSITMNGAGSIFVSVLADQDTDSRGGVYEFNADGVFQRRLEIEMDYWGSLASGPDNSLWYTDPWRSDLQRQTGSGINRIELSELSRASNQEIGNVVAVATYPNGDVGIVTNSSHLVRIALNPN